MRIVKNGINPQSIEHEGKRISTYSLMIELSDTIEITDVELDEIYWAYDNTTFRRKCEQYMSGQEIKILSFAQYLRELIQMAR
jgi:hypothetical protein